MRVQCPKLRNMAHTTPFIYYINALKQELDGTRSYMYKQTENDEISVVYAQLNEMPVKFSVRVNEGQDKFLR